MTLHIFVVARFDVSDAQSCSQSRLTSAKRHYCPTACSFFLKTISHLVFLKQNTSELMLQHHLPIDLSERRY